MVRVWVDGEEVTPGPPLGFMLIALVGVLFLIVGVVKLWLAA